VSRATAQRAVQGGNRRTVIFEFVINAAFVLASNHSIRSTSVVLAQLEVHRTSSQQNDIVALVTKFGRPRGVHVTPAIKAVYYATT